MTPNRLIILLAASALFATAADAQPFYPRQGRIEVPVLSGGRPATMEACSWTGFVQGLDPRGDGFLSVRSGPGGRVFQEIDRVYNGQQVFVCDIAGPWYGVVYPSGRQNCGIDVSWPTRLPYTGPCRYGWIHSRYVSDLAG